MSGLIWVRVWLVASVVRVSRLDLGTNEGMKYLDIFTYHCKTPLYLGHCILFSIL